MSSELIGILGVGAALAALMAGLVAWLRADIGRLDKRVTEHCERLARIEGLLEGLGRRHAGTTLAHGN